MEARTLSALEFGKVLSLLAARCVSEAGNAACLALRPLDDLAAVRRAGAMHEEARRWIAESGFRIASFPTLDGLLRYLESPAAVLDADGLWALRQCMGLARRMVQTINEGGHAGLGWPLLHELAGRFPLPARTLSGLDRCIGDDGILKDESSPELMLVRGEIRRIHQQCTRKVKDYAQQYNIAHYLQDEFMTLSSDRYVLPLKSNFKGRLQGIIHEYSQTGETCYFEPMFLVELNNRLQELKREEREEERKVMRFLTDLVRGELAQVRGAYALLIEGDVLQAKCALGAAYDGIALDVDTNTSLLLRSARHPLLALAGHNVQPVDFELRRGERGLVISGGNAGGKTVSLKTVGLIAAMALAGLPVPVAHGSGLPAWLRIFAFIGDEQSLEDHVSTFTAQIRHLSRVWDALDAQTLVILDEFGAGTDPAQGAALAQAVLDGVLESGAWVVVATHFPALKAYALSREGVRAASVLFDPATKKPLFHLAYDQVGASQALDVAREHGLPESVLKRAEQYLLLDGEDTTALVDRLNTLAVDREKELATLKAEQQRLREKRARVEERFERERKQLFETVQTQATAIMREWKSGRATAKQALKELSGVRKQIATSGTESPEAQVAQARPTVDIATVRVGQQVFHQPWGKKAVVAEVDTRRNRVRVDINGVFLWADAKDIGTSDEKPRERTGTVSVISAASMPSLRVDLRGKRADVALEELSRFLDGALLSGRSTVEIIHGRGTGALRKEVHAFLKSFPAAIAFSLAPEDQGGDGVTLVELK